MSVVIQRLFVHGSVADPGFPRGGGANPRGGAATYYLVKFSRKLHENEEILGQGGARPSRPPLRSATVDDGKVNFLQPNQIKIAQLIDF